MKHASLLLALPLSSLSFPNVSARLGWSASHLFQDADCIFLNKEELEVKVDLLRRQLELLKCVFEEVSFSGLSPEPVLPHPLGAPDFYSSQSLLDRSRPKP